MYHAPFILLCALVVFGFLHLAWREKVKRDK